MGFGKLLHNPPAGVAIQQAVDFDLEWNAGNQTRPDHLFLPGHQHGVEFIGLHPGNDLLGFEVFSLQGSIPLEQFRVLGLIDRQFSGEPGIDVTAHQQGLGGGLYPLTPQLRQGRRLAFGKGFELSGAHIGHVDFRIVIVLSGNHRKAHYSTSSPSASILGEPAS